MRIRVVWGGRRTRTGARMAAPAREKNKRTRDDFVESGNAMLATVDCFDTSRMLGGTASSSSMASVRWEGVDDDDMLDEEDEGAFGARRMRQDEVEAYQMLVYTERERSNVLALVTPDMIRTITEQAQRDAALADDSE